MLLDEILPVYDVHERHSIVVRAGVERVYEALWTADLGSPIVRALMGLRALPAALTAASRRREERSRVGERSQAAITLTDVIARGFSLLAADPPREVVLGVVGAFWRARGDLRRVDRAAFLGVQPPGTARAAWNFKVVQLRDGRAVLSTETRVQCADVASRRRFRVYWIVVRPGSGLIRRSMLRSVRRAAEG